MRRDRGFTLVEVLVAFVILALTLTAALAAIAAALRWESRAEETMSALLLARSHLDEIGVSRPLADGASEAVLSGGETVRIDMRRVDPVPVTGAPRLAAWMATVEVTTPGGHSVRLDELKLAPP